jgi:hypothetical protein
MSTAAVTPEEALRLYREAEKVIRDQSSSAGDIQAAKQAYSVVETLMAKSSGIKWQERGPADNTTIKEWRKQVYRPEAKRWGNRGGKSREYFAQKYGRKNRKEE